MNHRGTGHLSARQFGACRASLAHYEDFLSGPSDLVVISGDFNNSVYWDRPTKWAKFGDFMDQLEARGFASAYHSYYGSERGAEPHPTIWWMKNVDTTYHIDYTFVSPSDAIEAVAMGTQADWITHSDHSPMTVDLRINPRRSNLIAAPRFSHQEDSEPDDEAQDREVIHHTAEPQDVRQSIPARAAHGKL